MKGEEKNKVLGGVLCSMKQKAKALTQKCVRAKGVKIFKK